MNRMDENKDDVWKNTFQVINWEAGEEVLQGILTKNNHLLFLLDGELEIVYGSLKPRTIPAGNMILLSALSNSVCRTLTPVEVVLLSFDGCNQGCDKYALQYLTPIFTLIKYDFQELEIRPVLKLFLEVMKVYMEKGLTTKGFFAGKIKELFIVLRAHYNNEELTTLFYPILGKNIEFKQIVTDNFLKVRNAAEYADLCGYSLAVFQRKFKEVFGETVYQWMQRQKAEQIKHRLMVTDINPKEIAEEFDFASPAHLNKFCKIWFGMTPSELRQTYLLKKNLK